MKDEEMAETYFESECLHSYADTEEELKEDVVTAFLAGLKAGRPQWHDLRENTNDLPKKNGDYWVYMNCCGNKITRALVWENGVFCNMYDATIIAWCEIPTFDKE